MGNLKMTYPTVFGSISVFAGPTVEPVTGLSPTRVSMAVQRAKGLEQDPSHRRGLVGGDALGSHAEPEREGHDRGCEDYPDRYGQPEV